MTLNGHCRVCSCMQS